MSPAEYVLRDIPDWHSDWERAEDLDAYRSRFDLAMYKSRVQLYIGNVHFHCTDTVSPGMADLSGHTACPGRV